MTDPVTGPPYPNNLKACRGSAHLTRADLARLLLAAAQENPEELRAVSTSGLEKLELGQNRPRPATARAIAKVLNKSIDEIFPLGTLAADFKPNPGGNTAVTPDRPKRGPDKLPRRKHIKHS